MPPTISNPIVTSWVGMQLRVRRIRFYQTWMQTRFPFRYGIASMSRLLHLFVRAEIECDGEVCDGFAADGLPPKWFTKNPSTRYEDDDLPAMLGVIRHAADIAVDLGTQPSPFRWWWELFDAQSAWARREKIPPLLAGLGTSMMERAVIDAFCRRHRMTFFDAVRRNAMMIDLGQIHAELRSAQPADLLPGGPARAVHLRHTVGLGDPLGDNDIGRDEQIDDGLPHSLLANIRHYGLRYFKIKLSGDPDSDCRRLDELARLFDAELGDSVRFTLDGNEQFDDIAAFRSTWEAFQSIPRVREIIRRSLLFVEQPLSRRCALGDDVASELKHWRAAPPMIIDESDAELHSLEQALSLGYRGTSHKNCKGVFKGIANAAMISHRGNAGASLILSAEDLGNVGPVALLQDLAVVGALGIEHVERNGHHYFAGLSMYPKSVQAQVVEDHPDLYHWHHRGFAALSPSDGQLSLGSVNLAPFGLTRPPDMEPFESCSRP